MRIPLGRYSAQYDPMRDCFIISIAATRYPLGAWHRETILEHDTGGLCLTLEHGGHYLSAAQVSRLQRAAMKARPAI